jgi:hypothetical protein
MRHSGKGIGVPEREPPLAQFHPLKSQPRVHLEDRVAQKLILGAEIGGAFPEKRRKVLENVRRGENLVLKDGFMEEKNENDNLEQQSEEKIPSHMPLLRYQPDVFGANHSMHFQMMRHASPHSQCETQK